MNGDDSPLKKSGDAAEESFSAKSSTETSGSCSKTTWVDIELLDDQGNPVPNEPYRLTLPDGRVIEGKLNEKGLAGVDGIDPGDCKIEFPNLHKNAAELQE